MRLTCPNCGAQYEVPDEVIPESGRDVQCSNCGETWFQHHPNFPPPADDETHEEAWNAPAAGGIEDAELVSTPKSPEMAADPAAEKPADPPSEPTRPKLDSSVTDVLRAEAERERAARAEARTSALETQAELGLERGKNSTLKDAGETARAERQPAEAPDPAMPGRDGDPAESPAQGDPDPGTRRNLLPNIDEINSSLDADKRSTRSAEADELDTPQPRKKGGFGRGFLTVVLLAVIALLLYVFAPDLAQTIPALEGALAAYVAFVDALRAWLDQTVAGLLD